MGGDTKNCGSCGDRERNPNPLDYCGRENLGCFNPCGTGPKNSARCESLPSQIENFTLQFFGTVVKTEINGKVTWSLPCQLDEGLPGNPRGVDEGLACYFLRLFRDGLGGLKGDPGDKGDPGQNGTNAYTVVTQGFNQPTPQAPLVQFLVVPNPAILAGMNVFVVGSGYYLVTSVLSGGIIFATFQVAAPNPVSYVQPGSLVIPTGANATGVPGSPGVQGDKGDPGSPGLPGPAGSNITAQNGFVVATSANSPYSLTSSYGVVSFGGLLLEFTAPDTGTYLVTATFPIATTIQTATVANSPELVYTKFKLRNTTTNIDFAGTETFTAFVFTNTAQVQVQQVTVCAVLQAGLGESVSVEGFADAPQPGNTVGLAWATLNAATLSWVRIA